MVIKINCSFLLLAFCSISIFYSIASVKGKGNYYSNPSLSERIQKEIDKDKAFKDTINIFNNDDFEKHLLILSQKVINSKNSTSSNSTKSERTNKNKSVNIKSNKTNQDEKLKKIKEEEKKIKKKEPEIEKEVHKIGLVLDKQINTSIKMNKTVNKAYQMTKTLSRKIEINRIKTEIKLNIINKHVVQQLRNQIFLETVRIQKEILDQQRKIQMINLHISEIKQKLPNSNAICGLLKNCESCTSNPFCGWCSISQNCVEGNEKGPLDGTCSFYEYKVCSKHKNCEKYKKCLECTNDVACGWCDRPGFPICMTKNDAERGGCRSSNFINQWRKNNKCPKITLFNFQKYIKAKLEKAKEDQKTLPDQYKDNEDILRLNLEETKKLENKLVVLQNGKIQDLILLDSYISAQIKSQNKLKKITEDQKKFVIPKVNITEEYFTDIADGMIDSMKDSLDDLRKRFNFTDKNDNKTKDLLINSSIPFFLRNNNSNILNDRMKNLKNLDTSNQKSKIMRNLSKVKNNTSKSKIGVVIKNNSTKIKKNITLKKKGNSIKKGNETKKKINKTKKKNETKKEIETKKNNDITKKNTNKKKPNITEKTINNKKDVKTKRNNNDKRVIQKSNDNKKSNNSTSNIKMKKPTSLIETKMVMHGENLKNQSQEFISSNYDKEINMSSELWKLVKEYYLNQTETMINPIIQNKDKEKNFNRNKRMKKIFLYKIKKSIKEKQQSISSSKSNLRNITKRISKINAKINHSLNNSLKLNPNVKSIKNLNLINKNITTNLKKDLSKKINRNDSEIGQKSEFDMETFLNEEGYNKLKSFENVNPFEVIPEQIN